MRVLISSVGTRGDVQPALALAVELRKLGCTVRLCVPPNFTGWAADSGFEARPISIEMRPPRPGAPPAPIPDLITDQFDVIHAAATDCDLIVGAGLHQYAARSIAELRDIQFIDAVYAPNSVPSPDHAPPGPPSTNNSPAANLQAWDETRAAWNARSLDRVNANRTRLGLAPIADALTHILGDKVLLAADATLGPAPSAPGIQVIQTGAWLLPDTSPLPPELLSFLDAGDPPLYLGLGSMPVPEGASRTLIEAARSIGRRVILSKGWADLALLDNAADCIAIGDINQQALFPRVAAVLHHGGAGTTTATAIAGVPQIVTPMFSDQFYWASRVVALGIGASTPFAGLSTQTLATAMQAALACAKPARAFAPHVSASGAASAARFLIDAHGRTG